MAKSPSKPASSMPKPSRAPANMVALFEKVTGTLPEAQVRKMFGYPAAFINGQMFSGLYEDYMFVRLSPDDLKTFNRMDGVRPFAPMADRPMKEYAVVPPKLLATETDLIDWLGKAQDYVKSLPPKKPKKKKKA
jgi:TfoX/Sxy family transcriptional regulator of competence genes